VRNGTHRTAARHNVLRSITALAAGVANLLCCAMPSAAQEQYPPPLPHTLSNHPAQRVIVLSIDGLHAFDLQQWVTDHPSSALALLSRQGVTYTNAHLPWDDPAVGLLAFSTGGTPLSTGVPAARFFDRKLSPAGSSCGHVGARIDLATMLTKPASGSNGLVAAQDPEHGCKRVAPHELLRVNDIFELVTGQGGRTAWAGNSAGLVDLLRGPSGKGLTEAVNFPDGEGSAAAAADAFRMVAVLHWIDGEGSSGHKDAGVPELFGMNFSAFAEAQRHSLGYTDDLGTPSAELAASLKRIDEAIARMMDELKTRHLFGSTWIIVTATYALSPADGRPRHYIGSEGLRGALTAAGIQPLEMTTDGVALFWLRDGSEAMAAAGILAESRTKLGIQAIETSRFLQLYIESPDDPRRPDLLLQPIPGVIWRDGTDNAVLGLTDDATHVALLVSGTGLTGRADPTPVPTSQTAALLLRALGMEKQDLTALHREHSPALPGVF
jgi:Type I phosphodiesterase / nucleotide pyrophosphatase